MHAPWLILKVPCNQGLILIFEGKAPLRVANKLDKVDEQYSVFLEFCDGKGRVQNKLHAPYIPIF